MSDPKPSPGLNLVIAIVTIAVMAGLFELACRTVLNGGGQYHVEMWKYAVGLKRVAADPAIGHEHIPSATARLMNADVRTNAAGWRGPEVARAKAAGTQRIVMLGDSVTFGWGVAENETMSAVIARRLAASGRPVEVINTGVGNYNTAMEIASYMAKGRAYAPDVLILNYFINDAEPTPAYRPTPWLARHAYSYPVLGGAWDAIQRQFAAGPDWLQYYQGLYQQGRPGWQQAQLKIRALAQQAKIDGTRLILANIPDLHLLAPYAFAGIDNRLEQLAAGFGFEYVALLPAVENEPPASLWVTVPDPHPNAKGHALMGNALADYLIAHPQAPAASH